MPSSRRDRFGPGRRWVIIGTPDDPRVIAFRQALGRAGVGPCCVIDYRDLAADTTGLRAIAGEPTVVRIEAPGRDASTRGALLSMGYADALRWEVNAIDADDYLPLHQDTGRIVCPTQMHLGYLRLLERIADGLAGCDDALVMNRPDGIALAFDKPTCRDALGAIGVSVPAAPSLEERLEGYDALRDAMARCRMPRVFVKPRYGSAGMGVVAYHAAGRHEAAHSTVELVDGGRGGLRLYNTRRVRRYTARADIRRLIDALCGEAMHVEAWYPKAGYGGRVCDLRIVTIAGEPRHAVLRRSRTPMTNLHLLNERCDATGLADRMGPVSWSRVLDTCRRVAARFGGMTCLGIDVAIKVGLRDHAVIEVNAFGDWLRGVTDRGLSTHEAQIAHVTAMEATAG